VMDCAGALQLNQLPNVHLLGKQDYESLPDYLAALDVCLIPYKQSAWTAGCFPNKLNEYLSSGRPVVATALPELAPYADVVDVAPDAEAFVAACQRALTERDPARAEKRRALARAHSLEARCDTLDDLLRRTLTV